MKRRSEDIFGGEMFEMTSREGRISGGSWDQEEQALPPVGWKNGPAIRHQTHTSTGETEHAH